MAERQRLNNHLAVLYAITVTLVLTHIVTFVIVSDLSSRMEQAEKAQKYIAALKTDPLSAIRSANGITLTDGVRGGAKIEIGFKDGQPFFNMFQAGQTDTTFSVFSMDEIGCFVSVQDPKRPASPTTSITASGVSVHVPGKGVVWGTDF